MLKRSLFLLCCLSVCVPNFRAEDFSGGLSPEEYARAGLGKLSAGERAALDALVARSWARSNAAAEQARVSAGPTQSASVGQAVVRVSPNTKIVYEAVESRIKGVFEGWGNRTVFLLENGQRWQVANSGNDYVSPPLQSPGVKITPASMGTFWLRVEGVGVRVRVKPLD